MKDILLITLTLLLLGAIVSRLHAADPVVTNVNASQRAGTKLVDISFDVADADEESLTISVELSDDSGASFEVPATALSEGTQTNSYPTIAFPAMTTSLTGRTIVWDGGADYNQQFSDAMRVRVIANDGSSPPVAGPLPSGMVLIPAGSFLMGDADNGSVFGDVDELPVHTVTVSAFYLDVLEVSKVLWDEVRNWGASNGFTDLPAGGGRGGFHPVVDMNWYAAVKWCNARSEREGLPPAYYTDATQGTVYRTGDIDLAEDFVNWTGKGYRLPTEAEWEKAARGTLVGKTYPWGDTIGGGDANYAGSGDAYEFPTVATKTTPVGFYDGTQFPVAGPDRGNGYGLYDMAGNVRAWCWDLYDSNYYTSSPTTDPRGPTTDPNHPDIRTQRGGSWAGSAPSRPRCANRFGLTLTFGSIATGLRTARGN